eukprot:gene1932-1171_t
MYTAIIELLDIKAKTTTTTTRKPRPRDLKPPLNTFSTIVCPLPDNSSRKIRKEKKRKEKRTTTTTKKKQQQTDKQTNKKKNKRNKQRILLSLRDINPYFIIYYLLLLLLYLYFYKYIYSFPIWLYDYSLTFLLSPHLQILLQLHQSKVEIEIVGLSVPLVQSQLKRKALLCILFSCVGNGVLCCPAPLQLAHRWIGFVSAPAVRSAYPTTHPPHRIIIATHRITPHYCFVYSFIIIIIVIIIIIIIVLLHKYPRRSNNSTAQHRYKAETQSNK